nr:immunoglobulin heavy chain junction region [Homo sapiens]
AELCDRCGHGRV